MRNGEKGIGWKKIFVILHSYFVFFLVIAFAITCSIVLFSERLQQTMNIEFTEENISDAAIYTFLNIFFLSLVCTVLDGVRREFAVERPIRKIVQAAKRITAGDFTVRLEKEKHFGSTADFNIIIEYFNQMAEELSGVETLRTDFISNVSHELKTPLSVIQNCSTLLQSHDLPEERRMEYAKTVTDASRRLANLITNILKMNRLENQQIYPKKQRYNLGEQLCECLLYFENAWEKKELEIETDIDEDIYIESDSELLALVWNNLFSNAIKFTDTGGTVSLRLKTDGRYAVVEVSDTGCGISPEAGSHIFEKFYQEDTSHATQGNGLGLALVKRVVDIINGGISVNSVPGEGSTFTVRVRMAERHGHENRKMESIS